MSTSSLTPADLERRLASLVQELTAVKKDIGALSPKADLLLPFGALNQLGASIDALKTSIRFLTERQTPVEVGFRADARIEYFVGRESELDLLGEVSTNCDVPYAKTLIAGLAGSGKSQLVNEFARCASTDYPGGLFLFSARDIGSSTALAPQFDAFRREVAAALSLPTMGKTAEELKETLVQHLQHRGRYLWIVDDLPACMTEKDVDLLTAPTPNGHTLITAQTASACPERKGFQHIVLGPLEKTEAVALLTALKPVETEAQQAEAQAIAAVLGNHVGALSLVRRLVPSVGYAGLLARLEGEDKGVWDMVTPDGAGAGKASVISALSASLGAHGLDRLPYALDLLRVAASPFLPGEAPVSRAFMQEVLAEADGQDGRDTLLGRQQLTALTRLARAYFCTLDDAHYVVPPIIRYALRFLPDPKGRQARLDSIIAERQERSSAPKRAPSVLPQQPVPLSGLGDGRS